MRITLIETSPAEAEAYSYVRNKLQNSYSLLNGKLEHHEWRQNFSEVYMADTSKLMEAEREKGGGLGRDRRFSPLPLHPTLFLQQRPRLR